MQFAVVGKRKKQGSAELGRAWGGGSMNRYVRLEKCLDCELKLPFEN